MSSRLIQVAAVCFALVLPAFALSQTPPQPLAIEKVELDPVFDSLFEPQKRGWLGADGAASIPIGPDRTLWIFGDTTLGTQRAGKREGPMVNNTIGVHTLKPGAKGEVTYHWDLSDRLTGSFFQPGDIDATHWYWPGTGVFYQGRVYAFLTRVEKGSNPGGFGFQTTGCTLFKISNTTAPPEQWRMTTADMGVGDDHFNINAAALIEGGHVSLLGYFDPEDKPENRVAILARLPLNALDNPNPGQSLEYWTADGKWSASRENLAPLFRPGQTETSLHYDPARRRYVSVVIKPFKPDLCLVSAEKLTGPWSEPQKIFDIPDLKINDKVHAYAGRAHPELSPSPDDLIITYVSNTSDFWSMFEMMNIYYPRFVRVKLGPPATAPQTGEGNLK